MEKTLRIVLSCLLVLVLGVIAVLRPPFGVSRLEITQALEEFLEDVEGKSQETQAVNINDSTSDDATDDQTISSGSSQPVQLAGVDVSHYQGTVDWEDLAEAGIQFAFAKATEGITYTDPMWSNNSTAAPKNSILIGGYHVYQPADDPKQQAQNFLAALGDISGKLPPVADLEKAPNAEDAPEFAANVLAFLDAVSDATGCSPMIYASPSFYSQYLAADLAEYSLWLAEYRSTPPPADGPEWLFWQYSQNGFVDGISGAVDLDWFAGDKQALSNLTC